MYGSVAAATPSSLVNHVLASRISRVRVSLSRQNGKIYLIEVHGQGTKSWCSQQARDRPATPVRRVADDRRSDPMAL